MRRKTLLTPMEQWDRTVQLILSEPEDPPFYRFGKRLDQDIHLSRVTASLRLFAAGDLVFRVVSNGGAERDRVWGFSSKGYPVRDFYMRHQRFRTRWRDRAEVCIGAGDIELVELPGDLTGLRPDHPAVRRFVATLRAGSASR